MKVWNKRDLNVPKDAVYVGRPTQWGNPYIIGKDGTREEVIAKYRWDLEHSCQKYPKTMRFKFEELKGKDLVCWCAPEACHADVLLEIANS